MAWLSHQIFDSVEDAIKESKTCTYGDHVTVITPELLQALQDGKAIALWIQGQEYAEILTLNTSYIE